MSRRKVPAIIAGVIATILLIGLGVYIDPFNWRAPKQTTVNGPVSDNVTITGTKIPAGITVTEQADKPPLTNPGVESLGPLVHITPGGPLRAPITIRFKLNRQVDPKTAAVIVLSRDDDSDIWQYQPAAVSPDGMYASIERTHLSWFWPSGWDIKKLFNDTKKQVIDAVLGETPKAKRPKCANTDKFKKDGYLVEVSGNSDALLSCTGVEKVDGLEQRVVKVVNNRNYPLLITYNNLKLPQAPTADDVKIEFQRVGKVVTKLTSKRQTVIYPSESQTFKVALAKPGTSASIKSDYSGLAQSLHRFDIAASALLFLFTKMGGKGMNKAKMTEELFGAADCMNAVFDLNLGAVIAKCFTLVKLKKLFDWQGVILAPISLGGSLYNWIDSEIRGVIDDATGRARQTILIGRPDEGVKFYGTWYIHGAAYTFNRGGTGKISKNEGPCNYTHMCTAIMQITWRLDGSALVFTVKSYESVDETGESAFDTGTAGEVVGKSARVTYVRTGFLKVTSLAPDYLSSHYLCGKGISQKDQDECGA